MLVLGCWMYGRPLFDVLTVVQGLLSSWQTYQFPPHITSARPASNAPCGLGAVNSC